VPSIPFLEGGVQFLDRHAARLDRVLREVSEESLKASYVGMSPVTDPDAGPTASAHHYRRWAEDIAAHLAPMLLDSQGARLAHLMFDEPARLEAVHDLGTIPAASDGRLDRIVELARTAFSADVATVTLMEGDRQRMIAAAGIDPVEMPRRHSISEYTLGARTGFVVGDTAADRRFQHMYATSIGLRFYAGYPLHSPSGQPVGTLAVLSSQPRPEDTVDLELLRDIAMLVQREMWVPQAVSA
jgi:GAF domain